MKYLYEFIGTFFLVLTVGMTVLNPNSAGLFAPLAIGSVLAVMIFAGAHISGAHYNPAVSLAIYLRGKMTAKEMIFYWIVQLIAAVIAGYLTIYLKGKPSQVLQNPDIIKALIAEFVFTFALCYVVLNVATANATKGNSYYGWAIGFTVLAGAYAVGTVSGAAFNPAVALAISVMHLSAWTNLWIFFVANLVGSICAAIIFKAAHPGE